MEEEYAEETETHTIFGKPLREPILGKHFELPGKSAIEQKINLNTSASYIPVYSHLKVHETEKIIKPPTPPAVRRLLNESYMDFYMPPEQPEEYEVEKFTNKLANVEKRDSEARNTSILSEKKESAGTKKDFLRQSSIKFKD